MYELFNRLLCYSIKEGASLPCGPFTTTAPAVNSHTGYPTPTTLEFLPGHISSCLLPSGASLSLSLRYESLNCIKRP